MHKKILSLLVVAGLSTVALAQESLSLKALKEDNSEAFAITTKKTVPFYFSMRGMSDVGQQESIERSKKEGVALQYFLAKDDLYQAQTDLDTLVKDTNAFTQDISQYYKSHKELKGALIIQITMFPGYVTPFQININDVKEEDKATMTELNALIKEHTKCNSDNMCNINVITGKSFINFTNNAIKINEKQFSSYLDSLPKRNIDVYTKNKNYLQPITYYLVYGTNGYHVEVQQIKKIFSRQQII